MRALAYVDLLVAATVMGVAMSVAAQPPARGTPEPAPSGQPVQGTQPGRGTQPIVQIREAAHVEKAKVGGGACGTPGVLVSDKGPLSTSELFVECAHRDAKLMPYNPETHAAGSPEAFLILSGSATFVYGGKPVVKGKNRSGADIIELEGGTTTHLAAGDVEFVPAGLPHWFKDVPTEISYYVVRRRGN